MHKALKQYLGFNLITNYERNDVDLRDGDGADVGDDGDGDGEASPYAKEEW